MRVAVIGGNGFIGSHVAMRFRAHKADVVVLDVAGRHGPYLDYRFIEAKDLAGFDRVIHCGGVLGTSELIGDEEHAVDVNIVGTLRVLRAALESNVHLTYITLGNDWLNTYSITKNASAAFCRMFHEEHGAKVQIAVTYNVYGPGQKYRPVHKIVPEFMVRLLRHQTVTLYNGGENVVDMVFVTDLAEAIASNDALGTVHYGSGVPLKVREVYGLCAEAVGTSTEVVSVPRRKGESGEAAISPYAMSANLMPIKEGLSATADYYRQNLRLIPS